MNNNDTASQLASELSLAPSSIAATLKLLQEGSSVPFIARYRKEATGNLDEVEIRAIQERYKYLTELKERCLVVLASIESQGKLTEQLRIEIENCTTKNSLEDLYLPFKPKRRTKAAIAKEKGLEPLAKIILEQPRSPSPQEAADPFVDREKGVETAEEALKGARDIVSEYICEQAAIRSAIRESFFSQGVIVSKRVESDSSAPTKFEQYYDFSERVATIPSHRYLAIRRGEKEGVLTFHIAMESSAMHAKMEELLALDAASPFSSQLRLAVEDSYKRLLAPSIESDLRVELKMRSDRAAVDIFAANLSELLLAPPLGRHTVIGIDPGLRTGCKCVVVNDTGKFLENFTIYPSQGERSALAAEELLGTFIDKYSPYAIAIGNGTAGRETLAFVKQLLKKKYASSPKEIFTIMVSESGASIYSASDIAREEFPELDLTVRGAISIARRLQDPLAELVKVDPKSIGVGQYQHDVYQQLLQEKLDEIVESCVNKVGVELNMASAPLLAKVSGLNSSIAKKIVDHRDKHGAFACRNDLIKVNGLGPRTFEQAAGFLRISNSSGHPLDASAVHPERYSLVEKMAQDLGLAVQTLIGNHSLIRQIETKKYVGQEVGEFTIRDIIAELGKPGRDPRSTFSPPSFHEDICSISDLKIGLKLEGVVTNVTAFGAFVDIGVHQDGLVHLSELSDKFIKEPSEIVKTGDKIVVEVIGLDIERKRISLSAKKKRSLESPAGAAAAASSPKKGESKKKFQTNPFGGL